MHYGEHGVCSHIHTPGMRCLMRMHLHGTPRERGYSYMHAHPEPAFKRSFFLYCGMRISKSIQGKQTTAQTFRSSIFLATPPLALTFCDVVSFGSSLVYGRNSGAPGIYFRSGSGMTTPCRFTLEKLYALWCYGVMADNRLTSSVW